MFDPMIAKLIVWDATASRQRSGCSARCRVPDRAGLITLIPFHRAILATEQWARASPAAT